MNINLKKNTWKADKFKAKIIADMIKNKEIIIPDFQRSLVWNDEAKNDFIDTLKRGFPFGSLLFYHQKDGNYRILDGFQRSSTINDFINNPSKFFLFDDKYRDKLKGLLIPFNLSREIIVDDIILLINEWVELRHPTMASVSRMQYNDCSLFLSEKYPALLEKTLFEQKKELLEFFEAIFREFQDLCEELSNYELPVLVVEGPEEFLPLIFERINNKGTKLTKYDIFNASWNSPDDIIILQDETAKIYLNIIDHVIARKELITDEGYLIEDFNAEDLRKNKIIGFYDFMFGYGRYIADKFPYLFGLNGPADSVNSCSFNLVTACLGLKNSEMHILNKHFRERFPLNEDKLKFISSLERSLEFVNNHVTNKLYSFKANKNNKSKKGSFAHSEFQILSLIAAVYFVMYNNSDEDGAYILHNNFSQTKLWKKHEDNFKNYLLIHYCQLIFSKSFSGSGDSKLDSVIRNPLRFSEPVKWESFERVLKTWIEERNESRSERTAVKNPIPSEDMFLRMVYRNKFTAADQIDLKTFDVEHIAPKNQMIIHLKQYSDLRLPIGSIGNLCYLPSKYNRSKQDKTIYQDQTYRERFTTEEFKEIESKYTFTDWTDLDFLNSNLSKDEFRTAFNLFLEKRSNKMIDIVRNVYFNMDVV